jgi:hypothetical protein
MVPLSMPSVEPDSVCARIEGINGARAHRAPGARELQMSDVKSPMNFKFPISNEVHVESHRDFDTGISLEI